MHLLFKVLTAVVLAIVLNACTTTPTQVPVSEDVDPELVRDHQNKIRMIEQWRMRGRIGFFELTENNRSAANISWQVAPQMAQLRLYHPLRGTLARLEQTATGASLTDENGDTFYAASVDQLLMWHLQLQLPFSLINEALTGRIPSASVDNLKYYEDGTVAGYTLEQRRFGFEEDRWHIALSQYAQVPGSRRPVPLPHLIEIDSDAYKIRIQISQWEDIR
ncbi:MAG: outer membrane lipoprotein LolB [Idiomarina sp.]|nr:outer membrane lipoprotein LolB [Idiomarina sp.]